MKRKSRIITWITFRLILNSQLRNYPNSWHNLQTSTVTSDRHLDCRFGLLVTSVSFFQKLIHFRWFLVGFVAWSFWWGLARVELWKINKWQYHLKAIFGEASSVFLISFDKQNYKSWNCLTGIIWKPCRSPFWRQPETRPETRPNKWWRSKSPRMPRWYRRGLQQAWRCWCRRQWCHPKLDPGPWRPCRREESDQQPP